MNCSDNREKKAECSREERRKKNASGGAGTQLRNTVKCGKHSEEFIIRCVLEG